MLGRKREDLASKGGTKKRKKWQEESDEDDEPEAASVTVEEMEEWKAKMAEEEKQEEREREKLEREARKEAERQERERQKRMEEEERERRELEEQLEREERERQNARREAAEKAAQEMKRAWDQPPAEASPSPVRVPRVVAPVPPVPVVVTPPAPVMTPLMQAQAAGANIAAALMASHPAPGGEESDVTIHVQVPAQRVKDLLGVQGRNIKAIKSQTGVLKVGVLDRNDPANVEIVGTAKAVEHCRSLVKSVVEGDLTAIGNISEMMDIDARLVSRLIGPKGQHISSMKDQSGAYLAVKEVSPGVNKVVITGFPDCVARGRELVVNFLNQDHSMPMPGPHAFPPHMPPNGMHPCGCGHQAEDGMLGRPPAPVPNSAGWGPGKGFAKGPNASQGWQNEWPEGQWQGDWPSPAWPDQAWGKGKGNWTPMGNPSDFGKGAVPERPEQRCDWNNEAGYDGWAAGGDAGANVPSPPTQAPMMQAPAMQAPTLGGFAGASRACGVADASWDEHQQGWSQEWDPSWQQRWQGCGSFGGCPCQGSPQNGPGQAWAA